MQFEKMPVAWEPAWMRLIKQKLAWYFDKRGMLLYTRKAKRKADRGGWKECS